MALKDKIALGVALPHRSPEPIDMAVVRRVAQRAETLGFRDLWVTENTLDHVFCFDPVVVLTYAAAVTTTIRLGASVVVLPMHNPIHVAHQWATPGLRQRRPGDPRRGARPGSSLRAVPDPDGGPGAALPRRGRADQGAVDRAAGRLFAASIYRLEAARWRQSRCRNRIRRSGWASGTRMRCAAPRRSPTAGWARAGRAIAAFVRSVPMLREALERAGRDPATFPISKRVFLSVDERPEVARAELHRWFTVVYHNPEGHRRLGHPRHAGAGPRTIGGAGRRRRQPPPAQPGRPLCRTAGGTGRSVRPRLSDPFPSPPRKRGCQGNRWNSGLLDSRFARE